MNKQIMKLPAAFALLALMFFAAPRAEALERVCMRANFDISYVFQFRVFWYAEVDGRNRNDLTGWSENVYLGQNRCVDVRSVPDGAELEVQIQELRVRSPHRVFCNDWDNNPMGVASAHANKRTLWLDAWGALGSGECKLWRYE